MNLLRQDLNPDASRWVGWHSFELTGMPGSIVPIDLRARRDDVLVLASDYVLASLDRDRLREWLTHPRTPLQVDETEWSVHAGTTYLTLGHDAQYGTYAVPPPTIAYLTEVI